MNFSLPKFSKKSWTILTTLAVIAGAYAYYFLVFVAQNESRFDKKSFRTLERIASNIDEKFLNSKKGALFITIQTAQEIKSDIEANVQKLDSLEKVYWNKEDELYSKLDQVYRSKKKGRNDTIAFESSINSIYQELNALNEKFDLLDEEYEKSEYPEQFFISRLNEKLRQYRLNAKIVSDISQQNRSFGSDTLGFVLNVPFGSDSVKLRLHTLMSDFMNPLLRSDRFNEFFVINLESSKVDFQTFKNQIQISDLSKFMPDTTGIRSGNTGVFTTGNIGYKAFIYNMNFSGGKKWLLVGCLESDTYSREIKQIDFWIILYTALVVILMIIGMPLFKLILMNEVEGLHIGNVFLTGLSIVVGAPLVILVTLVLSFYQQYDLKRLDDNLVTLSKDIESEFFTELNSLNDQLSHYDSLMASHRQAKLFLRRSVESLNDSIFDHSIYTDYNEMYWMDNSGQQIITFHHQKDQDIILNEDHEQIDLQGRKYFIDVKENNLWGSDPDRMFSFQSIISWTTGFNEIAIAKQSRVPRFRAAAMTSKFSSVIDVILPLGYGFAIMDKEGEVLLHSDEGKNLQENILEETNQKTSLKSALHSNTSIHTSIKYSGEEHRMYVSPLGDLPLHIVTFQNEEILKSQIAETWILALFYMILSFILAGIIIVLVAVYRFKTTSLKVKKFFFDWIRPGVQHEVVYKKLVIANFLVILVLFLFNELSATYYFDTLSRALVTPMLVFYLIYNVVSNGEDGGENSGFQRIGASVLIIVNIILVIYFDASISLLVYEALVIAIFLIINRANVSIAVLDKIKNGYVMFLLSWLLATSLLPVLYFYKIAYAQESEIWAKHSIHDFSKKLAFKTNKDIALSELSSDSLNETSSSVSLRGNYNLFMDTSKLIPNVPSKLHTNYRRFLHHARPVFNDFVTQNKGLIFAESNDHEIEWVYGELHVDAEDTILLNPHKIGLNHTSIIDGSHDLNTIVNKISIFTLTKSPGFYALFVIAIFLFCYLQYRIIAFAVNKTYGIDKRFENQRKEIEQGFLKSIIDSKRNVILVGLPNSGKTSLLNTSFPISKEIFHVNCILISQPDKWSDISKNVAKDSHQIIVLDNFEYQIRDHEVNEIKLRLLEDLLCAGRSVIISTEIHPAEITDFYHEEIKSATDEKLKSNFQRDLSVWRHIFSSFIDVHKPISDNFKSIENRNLDLLEKELRYGSYLAGIRPTLEKVLDGKNQSDENIILEIQNFAQSYYFALWNSLSSEERYVIYDLAKDSFINTKNEHIIVGLLKKGLLIYDGNGLSIINRSFTNFVLEAVKPEEALAMEKEEKSKGKWSTISTVLVLIILGLIILISLGQPDIFNNANAILAAIAAVTGMLTKMDNLFAVGKKLSG